MEVEDLKGGSGKGALGTESVRKVGGLKTEQFSRDKFAPLPPPPPLRPPIPPPSPLPMQVEACVGFLENFLG